MDKILKNKAVIFLFCALLTIVFSNINIEKAVAAAYSPGKVTTVTSNVLTNETITVTGNAANFNSGPSVDAATLADFENAIGDAVSTCQESLTINYTGGAPIGTGSIGTLLSNYVKDVMQTAGHDYEKNILFSWSFSYSTPLPSFTVTYNFAYLETQAQRDAVTTKVNTIIASIITQGMTDEQKEKAINDYIVSTVAYDTTLKEHSAYAGLFGNQKTVCQGYALLAYKMLTTAGLNARIVTGKVGSTGHAWNYVNISGNWYQLDTTWNDPVPDVVGRIRYDYFNLTDAQMSTKKHVWTPSFYPTANTQYVTTDAAILSGGGSSNVPTPSIVTTEAAIVNNMVGKADTISLVGLTSGQIVKIYKDDVVSKPFLTKTVPVNTTEAAFSVPQLGIPAGSLYITLTSPNSFESTRAKIDYSEEPKTATPSGVVVVNNVDPSFKDTITLSGLSPKDIVKAYSDSELKKLIGTVTVTPSGVAGVISVASTKLGQAAGNIYVTLTSVNYHESSPLNVSYDPEIQTATPTAVTVSNYGDVQDVVEVMNVKPGDTIKVYDAATAGKVLATGKVKSGRVSLDLNIRQLGSAAGSVWVSVKSINEIESDRAKVDYVSEP